MRHRKTKWQVVRAQNLITGVYTSWWTWDAADPEAVIYHFDSWDEAFGYAYGRASTRHTLDDFLGAFYGGDA